MLATHDTLVRFDGWLNAYPQLARSWQASADGRQWVFHLNPYARWNDGRPVTPDDVKFTFAYIGDRQASAAWIHDLVARIDVDGDSVTFFLNKPYSRFLVNGGFIVRILPRHIWENVADPLQPPADAAITVGSGPFVFDGFDPQTGTVGFKKNTAYCGTVPAVEHLEFQLNRTFDSLALGLLRGDIDLYYKYASGFPPAFLPKLEGSSAIAIHRADAMGIPAALGFNLGRFPLNQLALRKALALALNYGKIGQSLLGGCGNIPGPGFVPPAFAEHLPLPALAFAPDQSRAMLAAAGFVDTDKDGIGNLPGGPNLALTLLARSDLEGTSALLPMLAHQLKEVGIDLQIETADLSTWTARVQQDNYDLILFRATPWGMAMDAGCASGYVDSRRKGGGVLANVVDPAFHPLCDALLQTMDPARQKALSHDIQRYYADNLPVLALSWAVDAYPAARAWQGLAINPIEGGLINRQTLANLHCAPRGCAEPPMVLLLARKLVLYALAFVLIVSLNFGLIYLMPGDPLVHLLGEEGYARLNAKDPGQRQRLLAAYGLADPPAARYGGYLQNVLRGNWGWSFHHGRPVAEIIGQRLAWTLILLAPAVVFSALLGAVAGWHSRKVAERPWAGLMMLLYAIPGYCLGMIVLLGAARTGAMPLGGMMSAGAGAGETLRYLALPLAVLVLHATAYKALIMRNAVREQLAAPYVLTALSKGLSGARVLFGHIWKNTLSPYIAVVGLNVGFMLGGALLVEVVFSWQGMGTLIYQGVLARDYPLLSGALIALSLGILGANLAADLLAALIDPRIREQGHVA
jgi:peptide/nickel transport system substrate-binding protein